MFSKFRVHWSSHRHLACNKISKEGKYEVDIEDTEKYIDTGQKHDLVANWDWHQKIAQLRMLHSSRTCQAEIQLREMSLRWETV